MRQWMLLGVGLCVLATTLGSPLWAQAPDTARSRRPEDVRPATNPLLRNRPAAGPLPIPPLPSPGGSGAPSAGGVPGLAPKRVPAIPLNLKEVYTRVTQLLAEAPSGTSDTLFGAAVYELQVDKQGRTGAARVVRYKHFDITEKLRGALDVLRCSPELLGDAPQDGRVTVALVYPPPSLATGGPAAADSTIPEIEAVPVNYEVVRGTIGYPLRARADRLAGRVVMRVLVNESGTYVRHRVLSSPHPILTEAVEEWLYLLRCIPAFQGRRPVRSWLTVPFEFKPV